MIDITGNLHLHTTASDGRGTHHEVTAAAARAKLDFIIFTDHNIWVDGVEGWYQHPENGHKLLRLMGQEINDPNLEPECNHLLCHFVSGNLNDVAVDPQKLIDTVARHGGLTFLAHPFERAGYGDAGQTYPWLSWDVSGFTGIELWNAMSDAKWRMRSIPRGILGAYWPSWVFNRPFPEMLAKWDELLAGGTKVVAIGNSDAHAWPVSLGPLRAVIYPYEYIFRAINTHLLLPQPLAAETAAARQQIFEALRAGHCYVSNDLVAAPKGLSFTGRSGGQEVIMGDSLALHGSATLRVTCPRRAKIKLFKDGQLLAQEHGQTLEAQITQPGVYRVELYRWFWGATRGWVYTNPIYVEPN